MNFYIKLLLPQGLYSEDCKRYSSFFPVSLPPSIPSFPFFQQMNKSMVLEPVEFRFESWLCRILAVLFRASYLISLMISFFMHKV